MFNPDSYYEQPELPERERTLEVTVTCQNEYCSKFEVEVDKEFDLTFFGNYATGTYSCPTCEISSDFDFEYWFEDEQADAAYEAWKETQC